VLGVKLESDNAFELDAPEEVSESGNAFELDAPGDKPKSGGLPSDGLSSDDMSFFEPKWRS